MARIIAPRGLLGHIALAFSPDGATLAASGPDDRVILWDAERWTRRAVLGAEGLPAATDAAFAPDGARLATSSVDGSVRLWDVARGTLVRAFPGHERGDNAVAYSPRRPAHRDGGRRPDRPRLGRGDRIAGSRRSPATRPASATWRSRPTAATLASVGGDYRGPASDRGEALGLAEDREVASLHGHTSLVTAVAYFSRRPPPGHRQRRPDGQALGRADRRERADAPRPYQRPGQPGGQPRRPPDRLGEHRLLGQDLEHRGPRRARPPSSCRSAARRSSGSSRSSPATCSRRTSWPSCGPTGRSARGSATRRSRSPAGAPRTRRGSTRPPG